MGELKSCPFCGGKASIRCEEDGESQSIGSYMDCWIVECDDCTAQVSSYKSPEVATEEWNRRA